MRYECSQRKKNILTTYDPTQLQPIIGHQVLVTLCVIPCYKIICIKNSVCAKGDNFFGIQQIAINSDKGIIENPQFIDEFERIYKGFIFVYSWDYIDITPETFQVHARNIPAKEASHNLIYSLK